MDKTEPDWADMRTAELLPCDCRVQVVNDDGPLAGSYHQSTCASRKQPVVAVALREVSEQAEQRGRKRGLRKAMTLLLQHFGYEPDAAITNYGVALSSALAAKEPHQR